MFILTPLYITLVFFDKMVIPRSRSRSFESITRSFTVSLSLKVPLCFKSWSTRVVLPWSTCAIIAMFLKFSILAILQLPLYSSKLYIIIYPAFFVNRAPCRKILFRRGIFARVHKKDAAFKAAPLFYSKCPIFLSFVRSFTATSAFQVHTVFIIFVPVYLTV